MENLVTIPPIVLPNSLLTHGVFEMIAQKVIEELKKNPNLQSLRLNPEINKLVCTIVENTVTKDHKVDKKSLFYKSLQLYLH